jgi:uncharacterized membrane protein YgaE (UPF0421/DUF939 family)
MAQVAEIDDRKLSRRPARLGPEWIDRLIGSDPGLIRLMSALQAVTTIGLAMLVEWVFVKATHALQLDTHGAQLPPQQAALVAAQHHGVLVIGIMLGAVLGMVSSFGAGAFTTTRQRVVAFVAMPVLMVAGLSLGLALAKVPSRTVSLIVLVVLLAGGAYCRRFGPLGFIGGMVVFVGDFFGFFLKGAVGLGDIGWLAAEIGLGGAVAIVAQFTIFYPRPRATLRRLRRSYEARAREVARAALDLFDLDPEPEGPAPGGHGAHLTGRARASRILARRMVRLNETALMVDAQLNDPRSVPAGLSAADLHQFLFDIELAVANLARFAERLAQIDLPPGVHNQVRSVLDAVATGSPLRAELGGYELIARLRPPAIPAAGTTPAPAGAASAELDRTTVVVLHRFAVSLLDFIRASNRAAELTEGRAQLGPDGAEDAEFESPVITVSGYLPGSTLVSAAASLEADPGPSRQNWLHPWRHVAVAGNVRVMIQMAVAVTAAIVLGDLLSGRRFYWAVIAAFVSFMGANSTGEQVRKGLFRVVGTAVGAVLGGIGAHLVGRHTGWAIGVILVALFLGMYLMRVSYAFMVIGVTIMISQLYVQLDEYTNSLMVLRLEETAIGAAVTGVVVLCVLPLRTSRVARLASRLYLEALGGVLDAAVEAVLQPADPDRRAALRTAIRVADDALHSVFATAASLRTPVIAGISPRGERFFKALSATRYYSRNLLVDTRTGAVPSVEIEDQLRAAHAQLKESLAVVTAALDNEEPGDRAYVRTAALFDLIATGLDSYFTAPEQLALRDFQLIDGALAAIAETSGVPVLALDTTATLTDRAPR